MTISDPRGLYRDMLWATPLSAALWALLVLVVTHV